MFCLNGYLNGREKTLFTMANCCAGALLIRVSALYLMVRLGVDELNLYGLVSPFSSVLMISVIGCFAAERKRKSPAAGVRISGGITGKSFSGQIYRQDVFALPDPVMPDNSLRSLPINGISHRACFE